MPPELSPALTAGMVFVLGCTVGSFLNVVIHRLPRGESLVRPGSHCPRCAATIPPWANVPLLGYALLRGRCVRCQGPISARYPLVEALTGGLFLALFLRWGLTPVLGVYWPLGATLIAVTFIDLDHQIIPNAITIPGMGIGLASAWACPFPPGPVDALLGFAGIGGLLWGISALYERRTGRIGLGMGDVKLMAMLGAFLGLQATLGILVLGSLLGLGQAAVLLALHRAGRLTRIPFGPALAIAGAAHLFDPALVTRLLAPP
ncbi:MAG: prepilin peptidase [Myxococcota bacterium]